MAPVNCVFQLPTKGDGGEPMGGVSPDIENIDEKVIYSDQNNNDWNMLWPGERLLSFDGIKISPFQPERGLPHHPLLGNLSVFLNPADMRKYNELAFLTDKWADCSDDERRSLLQGLNEVVSKAVYGFWTVSDPEQIKNEGGLTLEDLNYVDDQKLSLLARILSDDEVIKVLGNNIKSCTVVEKMRDSLIPDCAKNACSHYADKSFADCMDEFPSMVCRDFIVNRPNQEAWSEYLFMPVRVAEAKKQQATPAQLVASNHVSQMKKEKKVTEKEKPVVGSKKTKMSRKQSNPLRQLNGKEDAPQVVDSPEMAVFDPPELNKNKTQAESRKRDAPGDLSMSFSKKSKPNSYPGLQCISECVGAVLQLIEKDELDASLCPVPAEVLKKPITVDSFDAIPAENGGNIISGLNLLIAKDAYLELPKVLAEIEAQRKAIEEHEKTCSAQTAEINECRKSYGAAKKEVVKLEATKAEQAKKIEELMQKVQELDSTITEMKQKKPLSLKDQLLGCYKK